MGVSFGLLIILVGVVLAGAACLGLGGYALYEGFSKSEGERVFLGEPRTAKIVGIIALLLGLLLICLPLAGAFYFFFMGVSL